MNRIWIAVLFGFLLAQAAAAQTISVVHGSGTAHLQVHPDILRMKLLITADGKDMRSAVAALKQQKDQLKQKLLAAGAVESSLKLGDAAMGNDAATTPQQRQIQALIRMQQQRGGKAPASQPAVSLSATVLAEWQLPAGSNDDTLIAADELEAKIKAAMPSNTDAPKKAMTPEEQELAEETAGVEAASGNPSKPNEPTFVFVHKLTDDERAKLTADSLADATADAKRLATAAGKALGAIQELSSTNGEGADDSSNPYTAYIRAMSGGPAQDESSSSEATGSDPSSVTVAVHVSVRFGLN